MSREEFMRQLEMLLTDVSEEEKREALSYYQSYFEDAGVENEERILKELETPQKVAATIKADLNMEKITETGEYTEQGFKDSRFGDKQEVEVRTGTFEQTEENASSYEKNTACKENFTYDSQPVYENNSSSYENNNAYGNNNAYENSSSYENNNAYGNNNAYENSSSYGYHSQYESRSTYSGNQTLKIILIIAIAILTSPVWLGALGGIAGIIFGIAVTVICLAGSFYIAGGVMFGVGIGQIATGSLAVGFALTGTGLLVLALAILATILCVWVCGKVIPWICSFIGRLWKSIFSGKE